MIVIIHSWTPAPFDPLHPPNSLTPPAPSSSASCLHQNIKHISFLSLFSFFLLLFFEYSAPRCPLFTRPHLPLPWIQFCLMEPVVHDVSGLHTTPNTHNTNPPHPMQIRHTHSQAGSLHHLTFGNLTQTHTYMHIHITCACGVIATVY